MNLRTFSRCELFNLCCGQAQKNELADCLVKQRRGCAKWRELGQADGDCSPQQTQQTSLGHSPFSVLAKCRWRAPPLEARIKGLSSTFATSMTAFRRCLVKFDVIFIADATHRRLLFCFLLIISMRCCLACDVTIYKKIGANDTFKRTFLAPIFLHETDSEIVILNNTALWARNLKII